MSSVTTTAADPRSMEYDIALTLLSLHSGGNVSASPQNDPPKPDVIVKTVDDTDETTKLILNCVISSEVEVETSPSPISESIREPESPKLFTIHQNNDSSGASTSSVEQNVSPIRFVDSPRSPSPLPEIEYREIKRTRDVGTQTDDSFVNDFHNNNGISNIDVRMILERTKLLKEMYINCDCRSKRLDTTNNSNISTNNAGAQVDDNTENDPDATMDYEEETPSHSKSRPQQLTQRKKSSTGKPKPVFSGQRSALTDVNTDDLVPIGEGNAQVPYKLLRQIKWDSHTTATRRLLTAVFTRDVLASHSLTGKPSPAFPNKPAKKKLDPVLVNDIVQTVVDRCRVPENIVRTSITTKCADESKMKRTKEMSENNKKRPKLKKTKNRAERNKNRENIPPSSESESDSDY